jgi:hypothetical protein
VGHVWRLLDQRPDLQQHQPYTHPGAVSYSSMQLFEH